MVSREIKLKKGEPAKRTQTVGLLGTIGLRWGDDINFILEFFHVKETHSHS